jgi:hypothetical protein
MKIVILGSGVAGALAAGSMQAFNPIVYTASSEDSSGLSQHKAIMRLRNPEAGSLLGCNLKPIKIQKMLYYGGALHHSSNITAANLYSKKIYGEIGYRSIDNLGTADRYLLQGQIKINNCRWKHKLIEVHEEKVLCFENNRFYQEVNYDYCISTIPLPLMLKFCGIDTPYKFVTEQIFVYRLKLKTKCNVNQTIYIPEPEYNTYRASLQEQELILECIQDSPDPGEVTQIVELFGLRGNDFTGEEAEITTQKNGKMINTDGEIRKALIFRLTMDYNILSFGRYAVWKPLRVDHLIKDIEKIKRIISSKDKYTMHKESL